MKLINQILILKIYQNYIILNQKDGILKLQRIFGKIVKTHVKKNLNLFVRLSNEDKFKNEFVIDFRQKDQIILNDK